jgi:hypothetical protein
MIIQCSTMCIEWRALQASEVPHSAEKKLIITILDENTFTVRFIGK